MQTFPISMSQDLAVVTGIIASKDDTNHYESTFGIYAPNQYIVNGFRSNTKQTDIFYRMICIGK